MTKMIEKMKEFCQSQNESESPLGCCSAGSNTCDPSMIEEYAEMCDCNS
ncbi:MAG: hypothetical protein ACW99A_14315 [Candidatus Kariarchaeaceae archaeon]|jgi:hypothetical protein